MMLRSLLAAAVLCLAALAVAPTAQADAAGPCPEKSWSVTVDARHTVAVHSDCTMDVTLNEGIICVGPWITKTEEQVGPVHLVAYSCGMPGGDPVVLATAIDTCPEFHADGVTLSAATYSVNGHCHVWVGVIDSYRLCRSLTNFEDEQLRQDAKLPGRTLHLVVGYCSPVIVCSCDPIVVADLPAVPAAGPVLDIDTRDYYACAPPSAIHVERHVGPHTVHVHVCDGGIPDRLPELTTSAAAEPPIYCVMAPCGPCTCPPPVIDVSYCKLESATPEPLRGALWGTDAGCDVDVETNWYCLYDEVPVDRTVGPVHVETRVCTPPLPPITA